MRAGLHRFARNRMALFGAAVLLGVMALVVFAPLLYPGDPFRLAGPPLQPPGAAHLFGTDTLGRDVAAGIAHGARTSLLIGLGATSAAILFGAVIGGLAGYYRGVVELVLMRFTEFFQTIPAFVLAILVVAILSPSVTTEIIAIAAVPKLVPGPCAPPSKAPFVLQARELRKAYTSRGLFGGRMTIALDDVGLELRRGETLGLVGESGSGKSTLARAVTRLLEIDSGEILLSGHDIAPLTRWRLRPYRKRIQMIFQDPYASLDPRQRIVDVVAEGPVIHGTPVKQAQAEARELLRLVGLDPQAADRFPHEFSGGQRQRIGIARALALRPAILVADEPVSALDVSVQAQVLALLAGIKAQFQLSMLFVTHDLRVALQVCDRIAVMHRGKVVEVAATQEIFAAPQHDYTKALFAAVPGAKWQHAELERT